MTCIDCRLAGRALEAHQLALSGLPDEDLMEKFRDGCPRAFDELFKRYRGPLMGYLASRTRGSIRDIEDLAVIAFVKILENPARYNRSAGEFAPWLFQVARNSTNSILRRLWPFLHSVELGAVEDRAADRTQEIDIREYVQRLPRKLRDVIALTYFAELTEAQTAAVLKIPVGTVSSRKSQAKLALKSMIDHRAAPRSIREMRNLFSKRV